MQTIMNSAIPALFDRYVRLLDDDRHEEWLALFADDAYYGIITHRDYVTGTNYVIVGEGKRKLAARVISGSRLDVHRKMHLLTAVTEASGATGSGAGDHGSGSPDATANFVYFKNASPVFCGRYHAWLSGAMDDLRIKRWMVVLDNPTISDYIYLPI